MSHYRLGRGTKEDPSQARPPVRRNDDQVDVAFFCDANNLRGCLTMDDQLLNVDSRTFVTLGKLW